MKSTITIAFGIFVLVLNAQKPVTDQEIPNPALRAFSADYHVRADTWYIDSLCPTDSFYRAILMVNGKKVNAVYNIRGNRIKKETEMDFAALPDVVKDSLTKAFPGFKPEMTTELIHPTKDTTYQVFITKPVKKTKETYTLELSTLGIVTKNKGLQVIDLNK